MTERVIATEQDRKFLYRLIAAQKRFPFTVTITQGKHRTLAQNRLQRQWMNELAEQLPDDDAEGWRAYCKLHFGVPILRAENEKFAAEYDELIRPLPYAMKLRMMRVPIDMGVTRHMKTKQLTQYLEAIRKHFAEQGVVLTDPEQERVPA